MTTSLPFAVPTVTQHHHPAGQDFHRVVVDAGPVSDEQGAGKTPDLDPLAIALANERCVPGCFPRGATAKIVGRKRGGAEGERLILVLYVNPR